MPFRPRRGQQGGAPLHAGPEQALQHLHRVAVAVVADVAVDEVRARQLLQDPRRGLPNGKPDLSGHWANPYTNNMAARGSCSGSDEEECRRYLLRPADLGTPGRSAGRFQRRPPKTFDLPYTEWGRKKWAEYDVVANGDYAGSCLPFGWSRNINSPHGTQLLQNNDALAFLFEQNTWHTWVPTSPNFKWPADLPPTWNGTSVGRWDGDTLIIETTNFNGYTTAGHDGSSA